MKYADKISAYIKCVEELKAGNKEFAKAEKTIKKEIENFNSEEVNYFMKYYSNDEKLCTFNSNRIEECYIFFAIKRNVDDIKTKGCMKQPLVFIQPANCSL